MVDGTFSEGGAVGEGSFAELYTAILNGTAWHDPDHYFLLLDLQDYVDTKIKGNKDYQDRTAFGKKCLINIANAGMFSSDRTILEYAKDLWHVK